MQLKRLPDISSRELLAVVAIAEYGSFIGAASFLNLSLPTLSRTIKRVEKVLGVVLFERSTRRVEITPAGRQFVAAAQRVLSDLQISLENLGDIAAEQRGQVVISTFPVFAHETLPAIVREYRTTRPQVHLQIRQGRFSDVLEDVVAGVADFGLTYVDTLPDTVQRINLRQEPLYAVVPHDHPLGRKAKIAFTDLQNEPMVSLPPEAYTRRIVDGAAATVGLWLQHTVTVPGFLDILNMVASGVGLGIVPSGVLSDRFLMRLRARPLVKPAQSITVGLIALRTRHVTPAASALMQMLIDTGRAQQPRAKYLATSGSLKDLPHGPYQLLWRPALPDGSSSGNSPAPRASKGARSKKKRAS